ncbi:MAG: pilus assembly protein PilM [Patescibacteria group bacterium]|jgi:type IV pilus assembly protein PilM
MGLFGPKKISYIGADLGVGGLKLVELRNEKGRARLVTYGFTERLPDVQPVNPVDDPKGTAEILRNIWKKSRMTTVKTVASLPIASVFSSVITIPKGTPKEQDEAIQQQARKLIPVPLEEMVLDPKIISQSDSPKDRLTPAEREAKAAAPGAKEEKKDASKTVQVLITGASRTMVMKYFNTLKAAGLEPISLESETFGLIRSIVGKDRATTMIVDMGAARTNIIIVENGIPFVTRSLDMGGIAFTKAMSHAMSIELKAAEQMKCDIKSVSTIYPGEGLPKIFEATVAPLLTELQYSMNLYSGQQQEGQPAKRIEKIILTGGSAALPQLVDYFSRQLNVRVYAGDPWARVVYPDGLRPILDEIGYRFAVATGLAMRDIE